MTVAFDIRPPPVPGGHDAPQTDTFDFVFRRDQSGPRVDVRLPTHPRLVGSVTLRRPIH